MVNQTLILLHQGAATDEVYAFDVKPRDIQSVVVRLNYGFDGSGLDKDQASSDKKSPGFDRGFFLEAATGALIIPSPKIRHRWGSRCP
jgi:hypothetical protein